MPFFIGQFTAVVQASFGFFFHGFNSFVRLFIRQRTFFSVIPDRSTIILLQILIAGFVKRPGRVFLLLTSHLIAFLSVAGHLSKLSPFVSERVQHRLISRLFDIQFLQTGDHFPTSYTLGIFSILCNQEMISPFVHICHSHYKPHKHPTQNCTLWNFHQKL